MKKYFLLLLLPLLLLAACNKESDAWETFKHKYADRGTTIHLNGLMRLGLQIFALTDQDEETRALMNIAKKMKDIEVHIIPASQAHFSSSDVHKLSGVLSKSDYESLISVRKGSQTVNLWARGDKDTFSDPLALIIDGDELIMVEMKGTLTASDIRTLTQTGMKYADGN